MKNVFSLTAGLLLALAGQAQSGTKISGTIKDGDNPKVIEAATISLLKAKDSSLVKATYSEKSGAFLFEGVKPGQYLVMASSIGHNKVYSNHFGISAAVPELGIGTLQLIPSEKNLKGVTVIAKKALIEHRADKTVVNVEANINNAGSTAMDVLEKSPGVTVDKDGNISLKGKQGVKIMVDGKPSYLSGADLANLLKSMTASQLDQIEIMTNPPARYDAAGNAGVINIKLKKNKVAGFNGSITSNYTQGQHYKTSHSLNFNYRQQKINLFGNSSYRNERSFQDLIIQRKFRDKSTRDLLSIFDQEANIRVRRQGIDTRLGLDYSLSKKTTVGVQLSGYSNPEKFRNKNTTLIQDRNGTPEAQTLSTTNMDMNWKNFSSNLNFRHIFDSTGQEITADFDYINYSSTNSQALSNYFYDASGSKIAPNDTLLGNLPSDVTIYSAKTDYSRPLKDNARLEAGLKWSSVKTDNNVKYDSLRNNIRTPDANRSNHFVYEEQIQAAYLSLNTPLNKKWDMQVGLRFENTVSKGNQLTTGQHFSRNYSQLFPTAYLGYKLNDANSFSLNYGRRIERPDYSDLNPFFFFLDRYTYETGNPMLRPQFAHNVELSHTYKNLLNTTLNYYKATDLIESVFEQNELKQETYVKKSNIASQEQIGLAVNLSLPVQKWLSINLYNNLSYNHFKGFLNNTNVDLSSTYLTSNLSAQMSFNKGWKASIDGMYRSKRADGILMISDMGMLNAGISKNVMENKGTIKLSARDIFWSQKFKGVAEYSYIDTWFKQQRDSRQLSLSFTYRFGKGKPAASRRQIGGADAEKGRVKSGS